MLKYIFTALFVGLVWAVVWWFELPWWIAIAITALAVAILVTIAIVVRVRARRAAKEIESALRAQADFEAKSARPDREADIAALHEEFDNAIAALKSSRIGARGAASALYSLPWYVIVGPPGAGKSTALRNSGLNFPFRSTRGGASVKGVGGTRNCEWWLTSEAIILDTAGRYTTDEGDRDEWFAFLDLLRKYRAKTPINGVLAAVSVSDLTDAHPDEVAELARQVRSRIDELQERLGAVVPVYVVLTKCDLLPGFVEMFSDLRGDERHQIWGFTLPAQAQGDLAGRFREYYEELTSVLEKRALRRLAEERRADARDKIHEFPQYIAGLADPLMRFVHELTQSSIHHESPILRGVYLSSGTQEGRPIDRIMTAIAEAFGIRRSLPHNTAPVVDAKSYFLGDLFARVIFPDFRLTRLNRSRTRRRRVVMNTFGTVALVTSIGAIWLPLVSFQGNRALVDRGSVGLAYVDQHIAEDTVDTIPIDRIAPLRNVVAELEQHELEGAPWPLRFGMYQGDLLRPRLRDLYAATIRRELLLPIVERELAALQEFLIEYGISNEAPSDADYDENFQRLRFYLLLSGPTVAGEPGLVEEERKWLVEAIAERWTDPLRQAGDPATLSNIEAVGRTYVDILATAPALAFERDARLVERVQKVLKRSNRTNAVVRALVASVDGPVFKLRDMVSVPAMRNDDRLIRAAFTRRGYEDQVKPRLEGDLDDLLDEQWVLGRYGDDGENLLAEEVEAIRTEYYRRYIVEWRSFVDSIYIDAPDDYVDALGLLIDLTRTEPYKDLFSHVHYNTQLVDLEALARQRNQGDPDQVLLREAARVGTWRARQKLGVDRYVNPRLTTLAAESAKRRVLTNPDAALTLSDLDVTYAFASLVEFGARRPAPAQPETGGPPPPPATVPIDEYQEQLAFVRDALQERLDNPSESGKLVERTNAAKSKVKALLASQSASGWAPTLEKLLWPPIDIVWSLAGKGVADDISTKWCNEVVTPFERNIAKRYPFNATGYDIPLSELEAFFHPESGQLWKFYDAVLKNVFPLRGDHFEGTEVGRDAVGRYRADVPGYLDASNEISAVMFAGGEGIGVEFDVLIHAAPNVKEISLTIDGETVKYRNGPESWQSMKWPGEKQQGAHLEAKGFGIQADLDREGEWGLFRLLEEGTVRASPGGRTFAVQWDFREENAGLIQIEFRPKRIDTPFFGVGGTRRFMTIFRTKHLLIPRAIMTTSTPCSKRSSP